MESCAIKNELNFKYFVDNYYFSFFFITLYMQHFFVLFSYHTHLQFTFYCQHPMSPRISLYHFFIKILNNCASNILFKNEIRIT